MDKQKKCLQKKLSCRKEVKHMGDPRKNFEGYADLTAYYGTKKIVKEEEELDKKVSDLVKVLKFIIRSCGFELVDRIQLKDIKSGRVYK